MAEENITNDLLEEMLYVLKEFPEEMEKLLSADQKNVLKNNPIPKEFITELKKIPDSFKDLQEALKDYSNEIKTLKNVFGKKLESDLTRLGIKSMQRLGTTGVSSTGPNMDTTLRNLGLKDNRTINYSNVGDVGPGLSGLQDDLEDLTNSIGINSEDLRRIPQELMNWFQSLRPQQNGEGGAEEGTDNSKKFEKAMKRALQSMQPLMADVGTVMGIGFLSYMNKLGGNNPVTRSIAQGIMLLGAPIGALISGMAPMLVQALLTRWAITGVVGAGAATAGAATTAVATGTLGASIGAFLAPLVALVTPMLPALLIIAGIALAIGIGIKLISNTLKKSNEDQKGFWGALKGFWGSGKNEDKGGKGGNKKITEFLPEPKTTPSAIMSGLGYSQAYVFPEEQVSSQFKRSRPFLKMSKTQAEDDFKKNPNKYPWLSFLKNQGNVIVDYDSNKNDAVIAAKEWNTILPMIGTAYTKKGGQGKIKITSGMGTSKGPHERGGPNTPSHYTGEGVDLVAQNAEILAKAIDEVMAKYNKSAGKQVITRLNEGGHQDVKFDILKYVMTMGTTPGGKN